MKVILTRNHDNGVQTNGLLKIHSETAISTFHTLELPYKSNQRNVSCIPVGIYKVAKRHSAKHGNHFHLTNVPGRDFILIHSGNYHTDIRGCILVGKALKDINNDGQTDVVKSVQAMEELNNILPNEFELEITNHFNGVA